MACVVAAEHIIADANLIYTLLLVACLTISLLRGLSKPEQDWYKGRALAESIKTSCWRYCMCAEPFGLNDSEDATRAEFRNHLRSILDANRHIGEKLPSDSAADDQITASMSDLRKTTLQHRKQAYELYRIKEQRTWYAVNAGRNKKRSRLWVFISVAIYVMCIVLMIFKHKLPDYDISLMEPFLLIAASAIGWSQLKKFNELASSYTLTAHEIGIIQNRSVDINSNDDFSDFVNEAEQAFSREHTQWVARQQSQD